MQLGLANMQLFYGHRLSLVLKLVAMPAPPPAELAAESEESTDPAGDHRRDEVRGTLVLP